MHKRNMCVSPKAARLILDEGEKYVYSVMHSFGLTVHVLVPPTIKGMRGWSAVMCIVCGAENVVGNTS